MLARYGLSDSRLLCIDSKPGTLRSGQADGLQPRTEEVIKSLGLHHEIIDQGCQFWEMSFWDPKSGGGIQRSSHNPDVDVPSTFPHETTIHQGRIERIYDDDLKRYSNRGVERSTSLLSVRIDEGADSEYPVVIEVEKGETPAENQTLTSGKHTIRCKHLIGADGAHSQVRRSIGAKLEGENREYIWGVMDFIADTKFPDIRRKSMVQSSVGSVMIIPRERIATGEYLTRIYVHMEETDSEETPAENVSLEESKRIAREKRQRVSVERIIGQAHQVLQPYGIKMREGTQPDWWAAYEIGQRMCETFSRKDSTGVPRVFLAGDACHTHSPKAGQGMNVSMMDAYNLSWKLAHFLQGVTPEKQALELLDSYEGERRQVARELIDYDRALSTAFSSKVGEGKTASKDRMTQEQLNEVWRIGHGFTSGCGIEYHESGIVKQDAGNIIKGTDYLAGVIRPGRRLLPVRVLRHADGRPTDIHETLPSNGRYRVLVLASTNLLDLKASSAQAIAQVSALVRKYASSLLESVILHPLEDIRGIDWDELPPSIYQDSEMSFFSAFPGSAARGKEDATKWGTPKQAEDAYRLYGVNPAVGALVVVRPDQIVGLVAGLEEAAKVEQFLDKWLRTR